MTEPVAEHHHFSNRVGWLRAAVMGANDGIVSTASLILGVAAAHAERSEILTAGMAGLVAGAMSMAAGEFVSVSSQADTLNADLERERYALEHDEKAETEELAMIYEGRGLDADLAQKVAIQLMAHDALSAHARDELGIHDLQSARPTEAALVSALTFAVGAALPLLLAFWVPVKQLTPAVAAGSLVFLALLGAVAARVGGAKMWVGGTRVLFLGALAMGATAAVGSLFGIIVA
ncbi:MAG: VIT family protein [Deltaproteobacteria bacterium]|nr:VIT family protein [Deltaproteobacteria bacterium]